MGSVAAAKPTDTTHVLPPGWRGVALETVISDTTSGDWGQEHDGDGLVAAYVVRGTDFGRARQGTFSLSPVRYLKQSSIDHRQLKAGDLLVEMSGGSEDQPTGRVLLIQTVETVDRPVSFSNFVKRLRVDTTAVDPAFFADYWDSLYRAGRTRTYEKRTTGIRNFKLGDFIENEQILLPPLDEQAPIVSVLRATRHANAATQTVIASAGELKRSLMKHLFTFGPVAIAATDEVQTKQTELGILPEHWSVQRLDELCHVSTGTTPSTDNARYWDGSIPFIKTAEIDNNIIRSAAACVSDSAVNDFRLKIYAPGTVFLAMYGQGKTRGRVALLEIAAATSQNTGAIVANKQMDPKFLWFYLLSRYEALRATGAHAQISHLNLSYVRELLLPVPPIEEQVTVVRILETIVEKIDSEKKRLEALTRTYGAILRESMSGQRRVTKEVS